MPLCACAPGPRQMYACLPLTLHPHAATSLQPWQTTSAKHSFACTLCHHPPCLPSSLPTVWPRACLHCQCPVCAWCSVFLLQPFNCNFPFSFVARPVSMGGNRAALTSAPRRPPPCMGLAGSLRQPALPQAFSAPYPSLLELEGGQPRPAPLAARPTCRLGQACARWHSSSACAVSCQQAQLRARGALPYWARSADWRPRAARGAAGTASPTRTSTRHTSELRRGWRYMSRTLAAAARRRRLHGR